MQDFPPLGLYRHYKGQMYQLLAIATHSESQEKLAVYQCLYGEFQIWVRPLEMFTETISIEGKSCPRFAFIQRHF